MNATSSPTITTLYFLSVFFFGTFAIGTLSYAILGNYFFGILESQYKSCSVIDEETPSSKHSVSRASHSSDRRNSRDRVLSFVDTVLENQFFEGFMTFVILVDIFALSLEKQNMSYTAIHFVKYASRVDYYFIHLMINSTTIIYSYYISFRL